MSYTAADRRRIVDANYRRRYNLARYRGVPTSPLPAGPVAQRVRDLFDLGWSYEAISYMADVSDSALRLLDTQQTVHRATGRAILALPVSLAVPEVVPDTCYMPSLGGTRRVQALMRLGWTHDAMRERYGFDTSHFARGTYRQALVRKIRAVDAMYADLCMTLGPSEKTRTYARNQRFHAPLAWTDIDDPAETPQIGGRQQIGSVIDRAVITRLLAGDTVPSTRAEKVEAMRRWLASGGSERSLCAIHGWNPGRYASREDMAS